MKHRSKFESKQQEQSQQSASEQQAAAPGAREFKSAEEMLRYDAEHTRVPPTVARRLQQSVGPLPSSHRPWWRRLFGGSNQ
jgi:hypothetical protein